MAHAPSASAFLGSKAGDAHSRLPAFTAVMAPLHVHSDRHKSWVSPDAKLAPRILFVSDDTSNDVYLFRLPNFTLIGTLTGFAEPQGMCEDASGSIWISNTSTSQMFLYSRTGTLMKTLSDAGEFPVGCAVNRANGDLAVTNLITTGGGNGDVLVFPGGTGTGTPLQNPSQLEYFFPAYDANGNLYVDGFSTSGYYILSECPSGSSSCSTLTVSGASIHFPGGLNWDRVNNDLIAGDQECGSSFTGSCEYAMTIASGTGTVTTTTPLTDTGGGACDVDEGVIAPFSRYFAGPCISESTQSPVAARWAFPVGGNPTHFSTGVVSFPIGAAISNK
jgi:hypothetical protein